MSLDYPVYDMRTGRRMQFRAMDGQTITGYTYGFPIFTPSELRHVGNWLVSKGFHVYANTNFGGVNMTAHSPNSWHYMQDQYGNSLGLDVGTYDPSVERTRIINEVIPALDAVGMGWHYARDGYVTGHFDHIHIDVANYGRDGGGAAEGSFYPVRKQSPIDYLKIGSSAGTSSSSTTVTYDKREPRTVYAKYGSEGSLVKIVQQMIGVTVDGKFGSATRSALISWQKRRGLNADGTFDPACARSYLNAAGDRQLGDRGISVRLIQWICGAAIDGNYGPGTVVKVKEVQRYVGLRPDGVFGPESRDKIVRWK